MIENIWEDGLVWDVIKILCVSYFVSLGLWSFRFSLSLTRGSFFEWLVCLFVLFVGAFGYTNLVIP